MDFFLINKTSLSTQKGFGLLHRDDEQLFTIGNRVVIVFKNQKGKIYV